MIFLTELVLTVLVIFTGLVLTERVLTVQMRLDLFLLC